MGRYHWFGQISNSMKASGPETRRANENKIFAFRFPIQCHCLLVSRFYIMKKCKEHFHQLFFFFQLNLLHFQTIHFHVHTEFISKFRFRIHLERRNSLFFSLTVKSKMFRFHILLCITKTKLLLVFLTDKKISLYSIESRPNRKIHRTSKTEQEKNQIETSLSLRNISQLLDWNYWRKRNFVTPFTQVNAHFQLPNV